MNNQKRELTKNAKNAIKERKVMTLDVKFKLNKNGVYIKQLTWEYWHAAIWETLDRQSEEVDDNELININGESGGGWPKMMFQRKWH